MDRNIDNQVFNANINEGIESCDEINFVKEKIETGHFVSRNDNSGERFDVKFKPENPNQCNSQGNSEIVNFGSVEKEPVVFDFCNHDAGTKLEARRESEENGTNTANRDFNLKRISESRFPLVVVQRLMLNEGVLVCNGGRKDKGDSRPYVSSREGANIDGKRIICSQIKNSRVALTERAVKITSDCSEESNDFEGFTNFDIVKEHTGGSRPYVSSREAANIDGKKIICYQIKNSREALTETAVKVASDRSQESNDIEGFTHFDIVNEHTLHNRSGISNHEFDLKRISDSRFPLVSVRPLRLDKGPFNSHCEGNIKENGTNTANRNFDLKRLSESRFPLVVVQRLRLNEGVLECNDGRKEKENGTNIANRDFDLKRISESRFPLAVVQRLMLNEGVLVCNDGTKDKLHNRSGISNHEFDLQRISDSRFPLVVVKPLRLAEAVLVCKGGRKDKCCGEAYVSSGVALNKNEKGIICSQVKSPRVALSETAVKVSSQCDEKIGDIEMFSNSDFERQHTKLHIERKSFFCDIYEKNSAQQSQLERYDGNQTWKKPFKCLFCKKCFGHRRNLRRHLQIHTGERPFSCDICHKAFN